MALPVKIMKDALLNLIGVFVFLSVITFCFCIIIIILQAIFSSEARRDWINLYEYCKEIASDLFRCIIVTVYRVMSKARFVYRRIKYKIKRAYKVTN